MPLIQCQRQFLILGMMGGGIVDQFLVGKGQPVAEVYKEYHAERNEYQLDGIAAVYLCCIVFTPGEVYKQE